MLGTSNFLKYLIGSFLTLLLLLNIVYAFNLNRSIGVPLVVNTGEIDFSGYYFGVSNLIESFKTFFSQNQMLYAMKTGLDYFYNYMQKFDISNLNGLQDYWQVGATEGNVLSFLFSILNVLVNVPFTIMLIAYFLIFLVYIILVIFTGISYFFYLINGAFYSIKPNTYNLEIVFSTIQQFQFIY